MIFEKKQLNANNVIILIFVFLYVLVDFIPKFNAFSVAEPQWLYLNGLNVLVLCYLLFSQCSIAFFKEKVTTNVLIVLFGTFVFLSAISVVVAISKSEAFLTLSRYIITGISLMSLVILLKNKLYLFYYIALFITITLFIECLMGLKYFFSFYDSIYIDKLKFITAVNHGNKNIFSAAILVKIPFVFYVLFCQTIKMWKIIYFFMLLVCTYMLLLLGTRVITVGAILIYLIFPIILNYIYKNNTKTNFKKQLFIFPLLIVFCYGLSFLTIKNGNYSSKDNINEMANVLSSISINDNSLQARLNFWKSSFDFIGKNPILGGGVGNWKIESIFYENALKTISVNGVHMHNDFLEVTAESGILAGLSYFAIFGFLIGSCFLYIKRNYLSENKVIALILLTATCCYVLDSLFNFPLNRPTLNVVLLLLIIFATLLNISTLNFSKLNFKVPKFVIYLFLFFSIFNFYPNYLIYNNSVALNLIALDKNKLDLNYTQVAKMLASFPEYDINGTPLEDIHSRYLINEGKYNLTLKKIAISKQKNPYSTVKEDLSGVMYCKLGKIDSAYKYFKYLHETCPNHASFYGKYMYILRKKNDTTTIIKSFKALNSKYISSSQFYTTYLQLSNAKYNFNKSLEYVKLGLKKFPNDSVLLKVISEVKNNKIALKTKKRIVLTKIN